MDTGPLADRLRSAMDRLGITTYEGLAEVLDVSQPTVSRWMNGEAPHEDKAGRIGAVLGIEEDEAAALIYRTRAKWKASRPKRDDPGPAPGTPDEEFEVDYNSAIARMPDHVRKAVIELARPYLED